jgi:hypothetical protein
MSGVDSPRQQHYWTLVLPCFINVDEVVLKIKSFGNVIVADALEILLVKSLLMMMFLSVEIPS